MNDSRDMTDTHVRVLDALQARSQLTAVQIASAARLSLDDTREALNALERMSLVRGGEDSPTRPTFKVRREALRRLLAT